jgi:hypothetical protein
MLFRLMLATISLALLVSCTITQRANPVGGLRISATEICVVEKLDVREDFRGALLASLRQKGFSTRVLPQGSAFGHCPLVLTYNAKYSWDFKMYMAWAELIAHKDGVRAGDALYSAPTGGWSMTTRIYESTESKVNTMVSQLFPDQ